MTKFFISYSRTIQDYVHALVDDLELLDHSVWIDGRLAGGQSWWDEILKQIRACDVFIYAISPDTARSEACDEELKYAYNLNRLILPVKMAEVKTDQMPRIAAELHHTDYTKADSVARKQLKSDIRSLAAVPGLPDPLPQEPPAPGTYRNELRERIQQSMLTKAEQESVCTELEMKIQNGGDSSESKDLIALFLARTDNYAITEKKLLTLKQQLTGVPEVEAVDSEHEDIESKISSKSEVADCSHSIEVNDALSIQLDNAEGSIKRILQSVISKGQTWVIESDELNKITLTAITESKKQQLYAHVQCRDKVTGSRQECIKKLGWETKDNSALAGLAAGALAYATGGAALLALGSKKVRDYMLAFEATRVWTVSRKGSELSKIAVEISRVLEKITKNDVPLLAWENAQA